MCSSVLQRSLPHPTSYHSRIPLWLRWQSSPGPLILPCQSKGWAQRQSLGRDILKRAIWRKELKKNDTEKTKRKNKTHTCTITQINKPQQRIHSEFKGPPQLKCQHLSWISYLAEIFVLGVDTRQVLLRGNQSLSCNDHIGASVASCPFPFFLSFFLVRGNPSFFPPYFLCPPHGSQHYWSRKFSLGVLSLFHLLVWIVPHQLLLFHCFHSCFTAVWALFPLLSAFQTSSIIITAPFSAASAHCKPGRVPPVWTTFNSPISFSPPFHLLLVCLDSTTSLLHSPSCFWSLPEGKSVYLGEILPPCVEAAWTVLQDTHHRTQGTEILLLFMLSGQMMCFSTSLFFKV